MMHFLDGLTEKNTRRRHEVSDSGTGVASKSDDLSETAIYNYTKSIIALSNLRLGHILVNGFWQRNIGDFHLDPDRFATLDETVNILHRRGFRVSLTIHPFISTESFRLPEGGGTEVVDL